MVRVDAAVPKEVELVPIVLPDALVVKLTMEPPTVVEVLPSSRIFPAVDVIVVNALELVTAAIVILSYAVIVRGAELFIVIKEALFIVSAPLLATPKPL